MALSGLRGLGAAALAFGLAACSAGTAGSSKPSPTPTPSPLGPAMVQVENSPDARPLSGLQQADLVFEYLTEGGITRMTALYFHPSGGQKIEPIRSARLITLRLQKAYQGLIFYSGASNHVQALIGHNHVPAVREGSDGGAYFARDSRRAAPHNLFSTPDRLARGQERHAPRINYSLTLPLPGQPSPASSPSASASPSGSPATAAGKVVFQQTPLHRVTYTYSASNGAYAYSFTDSGWGSGPLTDTDSGAAIKVVNVILIQVAHHGMGYTEDVLGEQGIDFDLQGSGPAEVFSRGQQLHATWDLSDPSRPLRIVGSNGKPLSLPRGLTWIHLVDPGTKLIVS
jgi:hypothetical protein